MTSNKSQPKRNSKKRKSLSKIFSYSFNGKKYKLTALEKIFCNKYLVCFCGADAYEEAGYGHKNRAVSISGAYNLLQKEAVFTYINMLLETSGFEDENIKKQHLFVINQHADLSAKNRGLDMYYKIKGKYAAEKVKFIDENEKLTDDELDNEIERVRREREELLKKQTVKKKGKST